MNWIFLTLSVIFLVLLVICYVTKTKEIKRVTDVKNNIMWRFIHLEREYNLLNNSIVVIEDELPKKLSTVAIGMKLSNEMLNYVEVDEDNNIIRAKMLIPNYTIDEYAQDHPEVFEISEPEK